MGQPHRIGIVGLGNISGAYLETLTNRPELEISAVADLDSTRAEHVAGALSTARAMSTRELLQSHHVDVVLNLTVPAVHAEIALAAIANGKHVYGEKPLASSFEDSCRVIDAGELAGVLVGCAPDTMLGTGVQTARAAIDDGCIGTPIAASAVMVTPGHERWHPNPDFYYLKGGGPLLDMGPYYISALVQLLGPVRAVVGSASRMRSWRAIGSGARAGERIPVEVDSHVTGVLEHASGALSTITTSFDSVATRSAPIEVHGEFGSLAVPDPNGFEGRVELFTLGSGEWTLLRPSAGYEGATRGVGLLDMLRSDATRGPRASGRFALHVLNAMTALLESAESGQRVELSTTALRPSLVPLGFLD